MATLKQIAVLQGEINAAGFRGNTKESLLDALESLADVQACLYINNSAVTHTLTSGFSVFDKWENSRDTKGIQEQPTPGTPPFDGLLIKPAGAGTWTVNFNMTGTSDSAAEIEARLAFVEADGVTINTEPFRDGWITQPGDQFKLSFSSLSKDVPANWKPILQMRAQGAGGTIITIRNSQFHPHRG